MTTTPKTERARRIALLAEAAKTQVLPVNESLRRWLREPAEARP